MVERARRDPPAPVKSATVGVQVGPLSEALAVAARRPDSGAHQKPEGVRGEGMGASKVQVARFCEKSKRGRSESRSSVRLGRLL